MADLVTHACVVLIPAALLPRTRYLPVLVGGALLPDAAGRGPSIASSLLWEVGVILPERWVAGLSVLHEPLPLFLIVVLLSLSFVPAQRLGAAVALSLGVCSHLALDLMQDHHGVGYHVWAPFGLARFELGWFPPDATVFWAPWLALLCCTSWLLRWSVLARRRNATHPVDRSSR